MDNYDNEILGGEPLLETQPLEVETEPIEVELKPEENPVPVAEAPVVEKTVPVEPVIAPPRKKKKGKGWKVLGVVALCLVVAIVSSVATSIVNGLVWQLQFNVHKEAVDNQLQVLDGSGSNPVQSVNPSVPAEGGLSASEIYAKNVGAVVAIANEGVQTNIWGQVSQTASSGSGFIISADGYVVSNYHVIQGAQKLTVITYDGKEHDAQVVGYDEINDVSLLKIEATDLPYVQLGSSDQLVVGDQVFAIGNPLGELTSTLTVGYVSAKERMVTTEVGAMSMIQTDAAINSGNSGGPMFNTKGEVVGITTAKYSGTSGSGATIEGIGFAIPIDDVAGILSDLKEHGYVAGAYIGVMVRDVDEYGQSYGLPAGAFVEEVTPDGAAEKAGLQAKDIIVNLGGHDVASMNDLTRILRKFRAGDTTTITVFRAGQRVDLRITLGEKPAE